MKKIVAVCLALLMALGIMQGCQETPEAPVVVGKNQDKMVEKAESGAQPYGSLTVPEKYTEEFANNVGNVKVHVDANVIAPDADAISMYSVSKHPFSQEEATKCLEVLLKGNTLYAPVPTEDQIRYLEEKLAETERLKASGEDDPSHYAEGANIDTAIQTIQMELNEMRERAAAGKQPSSMEFKHDSEYDYDIIEGTATIDGTEYWLEIKNWISDENQIYLAFMQKGIWHVDDFEKTGDTNPGMSDAAAQKKAEELQGAEPGITEEEARQQADALLSQLGAEHMVCVDSYVGNHESKGSAYVLTYMREYDGVPATCTDHDGTLGGEEGYAAPWSYERIDLAISEKGLMALDWNSPYGDVQPTAENISMLPFEDVTDIFKKMIMVSNNVEGMETEKLTIDIDTVRLGMMRITDTADNEKGIIIPVWDFFGTLTGEGWASNLYDTQLTINAIDGTVIDRGMGY